MAILRQFNSHHLLHPPFPIHHPPSNLSTVHHPTSPPFTLHHLNPPNPLPSLTPRPPSLAPPGAPQDAAQRAHGAHEEEREPRVRGPPRAQRGARAHRARLPD